jgi:hypothetical protein
VDGVEIQGVHGELLPVEEDRLSHNGACSISLLDLLRV